MKLNTFYHAVKHTYLMHAVYLTMIMCLLQRRCNTKLHITGHKYLSIAGPQLLIDNKSHKLNCRLEIIAWTILLARNDLLKFVGSNLF